MPEADVYEVYAVRYGRREARRHDHFVFRDAHDGPMPMDYFVWAIVGARRTFVVDVGYGRAEGERRGREFLRSPDAGLAAVGVDAARVADVIVTHMHYDHAGNLDLFPGARFHVQDAELAYASGRAMTRRVLRAAYSADDVAAMVRLVHAERVCFHAGDEALAPGVSLHHVGGHTRGLQVVRVATRRGQVVLASDAAHYYANMVEGNPFPIVDDVAAMLEGHRRVVALADSPAHVVPGHDPEVMRRYPAADPALAGVAVRLDANPVA